MSDNENNGLTVSTWGPVGWVYIHSVSFGYPVSPSDFDIKNGNPIGTTENNYRMFFKFVGKTLPCKFCRNSYDKFTAEIPIRLESRDALTHWLWEIHNKVNGKLEKDYSVSYPEIQKKFESFRAKCSHTANAKGCTEPLGNEPKKECKIVIRPIRTTFCIFSSMQFLLVLLVIIYIGSHCIRRSRN